MIKMKVNEIKYIYKNSSKQIKAPQDTPHVFKDKIRSSWLQKKEKQILLMKNKSRSGLQFWLYETWIYWRVMFEIPYQFQSV